MTTPTTISSPAQVPTTRPDVDVLVVRTDGTTHRHRWTPAHDGSLLTHLQAAVGGLIDVVALTDDLDMWLHDEGLYLYEPNPVAMVLAAALGRDTPFYGPVVFTGGPDQHGGTRGLDSRVSAQLVTDAQLVVADRCRVAAVTAAAQAFAARFR